MFFKSRVFPLFRETQDPKNNKQVAQRATIAHLKAIKFSHRKTMDEKTFFLLTLQLVSWKKK